MRPSRISWLLLSLPLLAASFAWGHRIEAALTVIELNSRTESVEIIHQLFAHDLEPALEASAGRRISLDRLEETDPIIADYISNAFSISTPEGDALALQWIGFEVRGDTVWVYQELPRLPNIPSLRVRNTLLTDTNRDQVNTVNLFLDQIEETLIFRDGDGEQIVDLR